MATVVVVGAGLVGLSSAMLLAADGHHVTVLERDPAPPPSPDAAWAGWERRGVNQFRFLHFFLPRFCQLVEAELPAVARGLDAAGALRMNYIAQAPASLTGGFQPGDERFGAITARRPVVEAVVAALGATTSGVDVRRGVAVAGLLTGPGAAAEPAVVGVATDTGEELLADLVVDAAGRRSPLPRWLAAVGGHAPAEEIEDSGFVYYARHFRSGDGSLPPALGGPLQHYASVSLLTLPADNGTWGLAIVASGRDRELRALRDTDRWTAAVGRFPLIAHWLDGAPLEPEVAVIARIEDRHRRFWVDGRPVATGVAAVGDAWACTNPSVGRGASMGMLHAVALRDVVRGHGLEDRVGFARAGTRPPSPPSSPGTETPSPRIATAWPRSRPSARAGRTRPTTPGGCSISASARRRALTPSCYGPPCASAACWTRPRRCSTSPVWPSGPSPSAARTATTRCRARAGRSWWPPWTARGGGRTRRARPRDR